ncbi:MAG: molecular chaperone DnaJ [Myxococcota bacterium]
MKRDYYEVLGVSRDVDEAALKKAYRKVARETHPDRNPDDASAEARFKEASEAFRVLSDADARRRYDRMGHAAFESTGPGGFDPSNMGSVADLFEGLFGSFAQRRRRATGRDLTYDLSVTFEEAALGAERVVRIRKPVVCETCDGSGAAPGTDVHTCKRCGGTGEVRVQRRLFAAARPCPDCGGRGTIPETPCADCGGTGHVRRETEVRITIPAGVEDGAVQSLRGGGEEGPGGAGDLHVTVRVKPHPLFERRGVDVLCTAVVSFPEAALGTDVDVPTLGGKVTMKLPAGTQSGKVFRLRGKGIAAYGGVAKGDQLVTVMVEVPEKVTRRQRRLLEELAAEMGTETHPQRSGFLEKLKDLFE